MISGAIFDLDGTLVDSEALQIKAEKAALVSYKVRPTKTEIMSCIGKTIGDWAKFFIDKYTLKITPKELFIKREVELLKLKDKLKPLLGAEKILSLLVRKKYRLALASSNYRKYIDWVLKQFNWEKYFKVVLGEEDVKRGKPAPDLFLKAAEKLNLPVEKCVVFEDSYNGLLAVKAAGMKCVILGQDEKSDKFEPADLVIKDWKHFNIHQFEKLCKS